MTPQRAILTYDDYAAMPEDGRRYELHEGELWRIPTPSPYHQMVNGELLILLHGHTETHGLGEILASPIDVILSNITVIQPDLLLLANDRLSSISDRAIEGPPTLTIQILSPSTAEVDRTTHMQLFAKHGVPYCWIVDPEARVIEAYVLREAGYDLSVSAAGPNSVFLPPFTDLPIRPETLWP